MNRYVSAVTRGSLLLRPQGKLFNTVGTVAIAATSVALPGIGLAVGASAAGIMGYLNRRAQAKVDRENAMRDAGYGQALDNGNRFTQGLVESAYQTHGASEMSEALNDLFIDENGDLRPLEGNDLNFALAFLADAEARRTAGAEHHSDLFTYSSRDSAESERRGLDSTIATINGLLNGLEDHQEIDQKREYLDIAMREQINADREEKDYIFSRVSRRESIKAAGTRALIATGIGGAAVGAAKVFGFDKIDFSERPREIVSKIHQPSHESTIPNTSGSTFNTPDGINVVYDSNGSASLVEASSGNTLVHDLGMGPDGQFQPTPDNIVEMNASGISSNTDPTEVIAGTTHTVHEVVGRNEFMQDALRNGRAVEIKEQLWQTGGTPFSDGDEVRIYLAGVDHTGITSDGGVGLSMANMQTVTPGEAIVTMTTSPGDTVAIAVDISPNGDILFAPGSPNSQLFDISTGKANFLGNNFQIQRDLGNGRYESIATWKGNNTFRSGVIERTTVGDPTYINNTNFSQLTSTEVDIPTSTINPLVVDIGKPATTYRRAGTETATVNNIEPTQDGAEVRDNNDAEETETNDEEGDTDSSGSQSEEENRSQEPGGDETNTEGGNEGQPESSSNDIESRLAREARLSDKQKENIKHFHSYKDFRAYILDTLRMVNTSIADGAKYSNAIRRLNNIMPIEGIIGDEFSPVGSDIDVFYNDASDGRDQVILSRNGDKFLEALFNEIKS